jgi:hypothetical protein
VSWAIQIPHRSREESLVEVAGYARHLARPEDCEVVRQLVIQACVDGGEQGVLRIPESELKRRAQGAVREADA